MLKEIKTNIKLGRTKEALEAMLSLYSKRRKRQGYNDLILISNRVYRADKDFLMGLIPSSECDKIHSCTASLMMEYLHLLKKNN